MTSQAGHIRIGFADPSVDDEPLSGGMLRAVYEAVQSVRKDPSENLPINYFMLDDAAGRIAEALGIEDHE